MRDWCGVFAMSLSMQIRPTDIAAFRQSLNVATQRVIRIADSGLDDASSRAFALAQAKTPRVTGALIESGQLSSHNAGDLLQRTISYGNHVVNPITGEPTSKYAPRVHEIYNPMHSRSYKWLEFAVRNYGKERFMHDLAASIKSAL